MLIGNGHATLLKAEQIPGETFEVGQHIKVYLIEIKKEAMRPFATFSRTHSGLVKRLFELNIPEIADGTVIIKNVAREAGSRTKISVMSRDPDVDPIGTCVDPQKQRKAVITDELPGEKIDIIRFSEQPEEYVAAALAPATVNKVEVIDERNCKVYVNADQLSLAIGKEGQNARLAARLTGFKIDIKTND
jgi:N utilization substance protein A